MSEKDFSALDDNLRQALTAGKKSIQMGVKDKEVSDCIKKIKKILKK
jgi:hypothetical protein